MEGFSLLYQKITFWNFPDLVSQFMPLVLVVLLVLLYIALKRWSDMTILVLSIILLVASLPYILALPYVLIVNGIGGFFMYLFEKYALILAIVTFVFSIRAIVFAWR